MTVGDLMAHTSGLGHHFLGGSPVSKVYGDALILRAGAPLADAVDDLARFPLAAHPGSRWIYSLGIDVAARVAEVVAGAPLGVVPRERLFGPRGMADTGFGFGSRALLDPAVAAAPGSVGGFGWSGAAKTHHRMDPEQELVAAFMTQSSMSFDVPELAMRAVVYGALE